MEERALFFGLASARLAGRARWAAFVLIVSVLIPYEVVDGSPQWIFGIVRELPSAAVVAAFSPLLAGVAILAARALCRSAASLAAAVLVTLAAATVVIKLGADAAAWDVLRLPTSFAERPTSAIVALSLAGAGANLTFKEHARRPGRALLLVAFVIIAGYYAWPARGEAPFTTVVRALSQIGQLPSARFQLGLLTVAFFALFPLLAVLGALVHWRTPARRDQSIAGLVAMVGLPALICFLVYRSMLTGNASVEALATAGGAALLFALLSLITAALEVLVDAASAGEPIVASRFAGIALLAIALQAALARPPKKGVEWTLGPSAPAEKLFQTDVPAWARSHSSASVDALLASARGVSPELARAFEDLTRESATLDVAGRRWIRLVAAVNEASRRASIPYYLDPTVHLLPTKDGLQRRFHLGAFRIEEVRPVRVGDAPFATLHVRALSASGGHRGLLGLSRDLDPFALVELGEVDSTEVAYREEAAREAPMCGRATDESTERAMRRCGDALRELTTPRLREELIALTERHELQHQIDGPHLTVSTHVLRRLVGYHDDAQRRANRELSAYLAELTSRAPPRLGLVHLVPFAFSARGSAEHHVAVIVLAALSGRTVPLGNDHDALAAAVDELFAMSDDALRTRARTVWRGAFGRTLADPKP